MIIDWDDTISAGDCFDDTSWANMVTYIKHSHSCDFTIYDDESSTSQKFKFSYAGNDNTLAGDDTTGKNLILKATSADAYPIIELLGNTDIHFHKTTGRAMLFYDATTQAQKFTYATNVSTIEGGHTTGDDLKLKANDVDAYPYIKLLGNDAIYLITSTGSSINFFDATTVMYQFARSTNRSFFYGGTTSGNILDIYANSADATGRIYIKGNGQIELIANTDIKLDCGGKVQFGTYTTLGTETLAGYITIKDLLGNTRKIAVIA